MNILQMLKKNNIGNFSITLLVGIVLILLIILCFIIFTPAIFYNSISLVKITDVLQICVSIVIALYVTQLVAHQSSNFAKRREIILEQLNLLHRRLEQCNDAFSNYQKTKNPNFVPIILFELKNFSSLYSILNELKHEKVLPDIEFIEASLKTDFMVFKKLITDSPFNTSQPTYQELRVIRVNNIYGSMYQKILQSKMNLYR